MDDRIYEYLCRVSLREPEILQRLRTETAQLPQANMQISPEQGQFLAFLVRLTGARTCLEVGTFTGYSALACALALPADGRLTALDISEEWTAIAQRYWREAGVADRITLTLRPGIEGMQALLDQDRQGSFDYIFIDADKTSYPQYCELGLALLRPGGLLLFDNVLWGGRVADPGQSDPDTRAIRKLNDMLHQDQRIDLSLVPIADGLTLVRKRPSEGVGQSLPTSSSSSPAGPR